MPLATTYRCQFADGVERTLTMDPGAAFPLAVRSCVAQSTPILDEVTVPTTRVPTVTWVEAPLRAVSRPAPSEIQKPIAALGEQVSRISRLHGVDAQLVDAVIHVESRHRAAARSPKGALGLMQVMPATGARYGVTRAGDLLDPAINLDVGVRYLRDLMLQFGGQPELALAAYNAGEGNVLRYGLRVPPFRETQDYVEQVLTRYDRLRGTASR